VIDRLAHEGVELRQHYVSPMCTPTRAALLTGRYPSRFGDHATVPSNAPVFPDGYQTLANTLRDSGYDTGLFGKWHLGSTPRFGPNQYGFNTSYGCLAGGIDPFNHRYKRGEFSVTWHRNGDMIEEQGHVTDLLVREARQWIESRDRPWFCYLPFTAVHVPVKPTQEWLSQYHSDHFDDDPLKNASFKKYAAYTSHMDHAIGQMLEALEGTCQRENTLIVFSSDNGAINDCPLHGTDRYPGWQTAYPRLGSNAPFRGVKAQLYEGGIRTPAVVNWRGKLSQRKMDHPVQVEDWMPTLAALAAAEPQHDPQYDGEDIWPLITGTEDSPGDRRLFWNFRGGDHVAVRYGDWKLISHQVNGKRECELFNMRTDPCEENDVTEECAGTVKDLAAMIREERQHDGSSAREDVDSPMVT